MILEATLTADYEPGSNQSGDLACADWRFLLPDMDLKKVVCLGVPRLSALKVLSTISEQIYVVTRGQKMNRPEEIQALGNVIVQKFNELLFKDHSVSLILLATPAEVERVVQERAYLEEMFRILAPGGSIYFENKGLRKIFQVEKKFQKWVENGLNGSQQTFWLTTQSGEMRTALPVSERDISSFFFSNVLFGQSLKKRMLSRAGKMLSKMGLIAYANARRAMLIQNAPPAGSPQQPPKFLQELARESGLDIGRYRYGLSARGKYNSNKIIFYLFDRDAHQAEVIIKMTRTPHFNCRLEHEWEMLSTVKKQGYAAAGTFPDPLMFGYHKDLAVLGQKAMQGHPFRTRTTARTDCPVAADAIAWLTALGKNSANHDLAAPSEVSRTLLKLFDIFNSIYRLSPEHRDFMQRQIERVAGSKQPFPVVFGHGDAGSWNVIVSDAGQALFLDWEAADPRSMPLWDLFYFLRSFGNWISRKQQKSLDTLKNFNENFFQDNDTSRFIRQATHQYCRAVGLDPALIAPMFFTCWMHRALRQATWADSLQEAHFVSVIKMAIEQQDAPGLKGLFSME